VEATPAPPSPPPEPPPYDPAAEAAAYPARGQIDHQEEYTRFLPLVKWLLSIPHLLVLILLALGAFFVVIYAAFAILFTRRYPQGAFNYMAGLYRWAWRVSAYFLLMVDPYPPFSMGEHPDYPARLELEHPGEVDRWRPFVQWFLAIPVLFVAGILRNLAQLLAFFALFTIIFTKRYPRGMFELAKVSMLWQLRTNAYAHFIATKYPPFVWA
jgi:Domain of unknown function (DUF4389)